MAGINAQIAAYTAFGSALSLIVFPSRDQSDAKTVQNALAALETVLGILSVNRDDVVNYNQVFATVTPDVSALTSATTALENDLGVTSTTPPS